MIYPDTCSYKQHTGGNEFIKQKQYDALLEKYESLNAKFNINQFHEPTEHAKLIEQVMSMGTVFRK